MEFSVWINVAPNGMLHLIFRLSDLVIFQEQNKKQQFLILEEKGYCYEKGHGSSCT